jgi:hypothetical protein
MATKILFLAANPIDTRRLTLDEELRSIKERLREAPGSSSIELVDVLAARPDDWLRALNAQRFRVVHFSGHGTKGGALQHVGRDGVARAVSFEALKATLHTLKGDICLLVFNACYSRQQAALLTEDIDCVIVMNDTIHDEAAVTFSNAFYRALFSGRSVQNAYEQGKAALMVENLPGAQIPALLVRTGVDASKVMLVEPVQRNKAVILFNQGTEDEKYVKEFKTHLDFYKQNGMLDYWDLTQVLAGSKKDKEILQALTSARVAILLVSPGFLASSDIRQKQLPILLQAANRGETTILPVLLRQSALNADPYLRDFLPVHPRPLNGMSQSKRDEIWNKVATRVQNLLQENP